MLFEFVGAVPEGCGLASRLMLVVGASAFKPAKRTCFDGIVTPPAVHDSIHTDGENLPRGAELADVCEMAPADCQRAASALRPGRMGTNMVLVSVVLWK